MLPKLYYRKYPRLVSAINSRYKTYNKQLEQVLELETAGRIFVFRPSRYVPIRRIERNVAKIQEMYDLGKADALERKNALLHYLS